MHSQPANLNGSTQRLFSTKKTPGTPHPGRVGCYYIYHPHIPPQFFKTAFLPSKTLNPLPKLFLE